MLLEALRCGTFRESELDLVCSSSYGVVMGYTRYDEQPVPKQHVHKYIHTYVLHVTLI